LRKRWPLRYKRILGFQTDKTRKGHIISKTLGIQNKERILQEPREKYQVTYNGKHNIIIADFLKDSLKARMAWNDVFQVLKENNDQLRLL
jgi:hypothetical protein